MLRIFSRVTVVTVTLFSPENILWIFSQATARSLIPLSETFYRILAAMEFYSTAAKIV